MRVLQREPEAFEGVLDDLGADIGKDAHLRAHLEHLRALVQDPVRLDGRGRDLIEGLALLAAAAVLRRHAPNVVADAFLGTRFAGTGRRTYGQGLAGANPRAIVDRALAG
jgi:putative acyl-CoA dehydrogenase